MSLTRFILSLFLLLTASLAQAADGQRLYEQNCAACHGLDGNGGVGVPLALPDFQYSASDDFLRKMIRHGRPGRVMPAFKRFSDEEVDAIVRYIRHWAPGKPFKYSSKRIRGDVKHGKQLYAQRCASCHGANGEGGKGTGVTFSRPRNLPIIPPALNNKGFLDAAPDEMIKATLMNGREGTPMVSFLKQGLKEKDINDIVAYVRSFEKHPLPLTLKVPEERLIIMESMQPLKETVEAIKRAVVGKNYRLIRVQYINQGLVEKGRENKKQVIVYFCNFSFLNRALAVDPRVGLFLPCRVTAYEKDGKVFVTSTNPLYMSTIFNNNELHRLCQEMYQEYMDIIEEATL